MSATLDVLCSSTARVRVLSLFLQNPCSHFYQREIERETGQPIRAVQREVERLEGIGLLVRSAEGNRVFYRLNAEFSLLAELTALFQKAAGVEGVEAAPRKKAAAAPEPSAIRQPFAWMETPRAVSVPVVLRRLQVDGEWDRAY
jgi:DNA-binding transcriptional ArsR family regulator